MSDGIAFRLLDRSWNDALTAVNRACPIGADYAFLFERGDDFLHWPELVYQDYHYAGMFRGERLVGYVMSGVYPGWTGSARGLVRYVGDARVLKEARGARLTDRAAAMVRDVLPSESYVGFCLVKRGNQPADRVVRQAQQGTWALRPLCGFEVANIPLFRSQKGPGLARVRTAQIGDLEAMAALILQVNGQRLLAPLLSADDLARAAQIRPGHDLSHYYLAERGGKLVGCLIAWDMWPIHRSLVLRYPPAMNALRRGLPLVRRFLSNLPLLPAPGNAFRALTVTQLAVLDRNPGILRDLLAAVINDHLGRGYHMLHVGLTIKDPLRKGLSRLMAQRFRSDIHLYYKKGSEAENHPEQQQDPCIDLQFI